MIALKASVVVAGCALLLSGCASYDNTACNNAFTAGQNAINNKNYDAYLNNRQLMLQLCYSSRTEYKVTNAVMDYDTGLFKKLYDDKDYVNLIKFTEQQFATSDTKDYFYHLLTQYQYYSGLAKQQASSNKTQAISTLTSYESLVTRYARELGTAHANYLYASSYKTHSEIGDVSKMLLDKFVTALNLTPLASSDMYTAAMNLARDLKNNKLASRLGTQWSTLNGAWGSVDEGHRVVADSNKLSEVAAILKKKGFGDMSDATAALAGTRHKTEVSNQQYAAQQAQAEAERAQAAQQEAQQPSQADMLVNAFTSVASSAIVAHASGGSVSQAVGASLNQAALDANASSNSSYSSPSSGSTATASSAGSSSGSSSGARPALSSEAMAIDLSGDCDTAERKGTEAAEKIGAQAQSSDAGICSSGKGAKLLGEITVRVAQACKVRPTWQQLEDQGYEMISQAQQTIDGSCSP